LPSNLVDGPTKCLLVQPKFSGHSFWNYLDVCKFVGAKYSAAPLGLMTVAALLPEHWDLKLIDENVERLTDDDIAAADIVMASGMLPQQKTLQAVITRAHAHGKPVAVGGPDPTSQPEVYKEADYRVLGEGEVTLPLFLEDLRRGEAKAIYQTKERADMARAVVPRFDLIKFSNYMHVGVQFCRGCPYNCEFCDVIELFGRKPRTKAPEQILRELEYLYDLGYRGHVDFVDDNLIGNRRKAIPLLSAILDWQEERGYPFYFTTEASLNLAKDEKLLSLMRANDFRYVFIGIETPDEDILNKTSMHLEEDATVAGAIKKISSYGMIVNAGFIVGFDNENERTAQNMISCIQDAGICMAMVGTLYALPNTQLTRRLKKEGRLLNDGASEVDADRDYDQTSSGLNFIPDRPTVDVLGDYVRVMEHIYEPKNYYDRVKRTATNLRHKAKHKPSFKATLKMAWAFVKVSSRISMSPRVAYYYWKTFFRFLFTSPAALVATVNLAAMYVHFHKQSRFTVKNIRRRMADIRAFDRSVALRAPAG
jgi:radical SAM superfamily enzyme YgiQ (UPF0313 family)